MKCTKISHKQVKIAKHNRAPGVKASPASRKENFNIEENNYMMNVLKTTSIIVLRQQTLSRRNH
jgi:hypothetical protein